LSTHKNLITHLSNFNPNFPPNKPLLLPHNPTPKQNKKKKNKNSRLCYLFKDHPFDFSIPNLPSNQQKLVVPFPPSNVSHSSSPHLHLRFLSYKPTMFHEELYETSAIYWKEGVALTQSLVYNCHSKAFMSLRGANVPPSLTSVGCVI
jgi:hypothetical protein